MRNKVKTSGRAQLFQNKWLEKLTFTSPLESSITSWSISAICVWAGLSLWPHIGTEQVVAWVAIGLLSWSLAEYLLHRYLFHLPDTAFKGSKRLTYIIHGVHHEYPNDAARTLMPFVPKLLISVVFFGIFLLIFGSKGPFFSAGFLLGYYFYSMMHYAIHRYKAPAWLKGLWTHHHLHHHLHEDKAFGVSSTLWDRIFNTMPPKYANGKGREVSADA
ncbi:MAG: sterol desaturase family protein [Saprospiraceae bacterium]